MLWAKQCNRCLSKYKEKKYLEWMCMNIGSSYLQSVLPAIPNFNATFFQELAFYFSGDL